MKKLIDFQHFGNISTDSKSPVFFLSGLIYPYILTKNSKVNKTSNFFEDFWCRKQFFEKNITGQRRQLIFLNPFLYSLGNFALKNIGLPPGAGWGCFQSSQDKVLLVTIADSNPANVVFWQSGSFFCVCFSLF